MSPRVLKERQLAGIFLDVDLGDAPMPTTKDGAVPRNDETTPYTIIEQHTYIDMDGDGYQEPYVVSFHLETGKVLRIAARFDDTTISYNGKGEVIKIEPIEYFTKFGFIPNLDNLMANGEYTNLLDYSQGVGNLHKFMAVCYRPIVKKDKFDNYTIEKYEGSGKYSEAMKLIPMNIVNGCLGFFLTLRKDLEKPFQRYMRVERAKELLR